MKKTIQKATVICDGRGDASSTCGARAAVLYDENGTKIAEKAEKIEPTTNIVAEHLSIQLGIELALKHNVSELLVLNDSQTPVFHVLGKYKVREEKLKPIVSETWRIAAELHRVEIKWVPRTETKAADKLCRLVDPKPSSDKPSGRSRPGGSVPQAPQRENPFLALKARRKT